MHSRTISALVILMLSNITIMVTLGSVSQIRARQVIHRYLVMHWMALGFLAHVASMERW